VGLVSARTGQIEIHYAPDENLEQIDVELSRSARTMIDDRHLGTDIESERSF
jgi:hypothetical protein